MFLEKRKLSRRHTRVRDVYLVLASLLLPMLCNTKPHSVRSNTRDCTLRVLSLMFP